MADGASQMYFRLNGDKNSSKAQPPPQVQPRMPIPTKNILDLADGDEGSYFANNMNQNNNNFSLGGPQKRTLTQSREISMPQTINNNKGSSSSSKHFTLLQNV